ncbi:IS110 family transposase [[Eubacterium] rectale]|nr:transposase [Agathobacter rectalis]MCB7110732.1 IS110 family transposase [Agathobacter rectalis]
MEPTGHYWFCLATWLVAKGIRVVQANPYAVTQTKEVEDNSQLKDDNI